MLKALELSGFKSFADRTRFDFPSGICVVVGPNGSGKSNVVDAVKWVLGSQSAKSLRGKEMTDVIFNGCASRAPLGTGEVTLTLENADRRLAIDSNEVHVTRRVYRSGEGEYLLNRQPCRLRDIRELLATTGITTEAYCIIEQGKVDALLQSSPRDRRVIFEEAAGISQFKAKKAIAMRRMERVEQNLLRLSDILDEVESRLRSVRMQAGKARRYRECTERLQQLRTEVALVDWRSLTRQIEGRHTQATDLKRRIEERAAALERDDVEAQELERRIEAGARQTREIENLASAAREQIAALQATIESQSTRRLEQQQEIARVREQLAAMDTHAGGEGEEFRDAAQHLQAAEGELAAIVGQCQEQVAYANQSRRELDDALSEHDPMRITLGECVRTATLLDEQFSSLKAELHDAGAHLDQCGKRLIGLMHKRAVQGAEVERDQQAEAELMVHAEQHRTALAEAERRLVEVRRDLARADGQHRRMDAQLTRIRERIAVLSELESRLEGLDGGVQEILRVAHEDPTQPLGDVRGVVADLFHVDVDSAPIVEVALGERAQFIVLASANQLLQRLHSQPLRVAGRVGFLGLDSRYPLTALDHVDLSAEPGVMGRADRFIESAAEYQLLARRLLGRTWLVDRMATALRLAQSVGRGLEFVTSDGELIAADGTVVVGPRQAATGMLSRRSELRACHEQANNLEHQLAAQASAYSQLDKERARQEELVASTVAAYTTAAGTLADCHRKATASAAQLERIVEEQRRLENELKFTEERVVAAQLEIETNGRERAAAATTAKQLEVALQASREKLTALQEQHAELQAAATERRIAVARCEQRVEMLRQQMEQVERSQQERDQMLAESRARLAGREAQISELDNAMLAGRQTLAELYLSKEQHAAELAMQNAADDELRRGRHVVIERVRSQRQQLGALQAQQHKLEVATTRLRHERQSLCERMHDDYGIDLEAAVGKGEWGVGSEERGTRSETAAGLQLTVTSANRDQIEREITELRDQINNIGAINLEALDELEQLEGRFEKLSNQYRDLVEAKASLERITQRINSDSRQLFLRTVETVRGHFQELFRRLFGGGEADIVVDEAEDVLECGIEIVARPPGKESCSISLLSGGEKTLTCVALLLAVFRSKPSPFCILDEVDAALDEANIGRFTAVLREFLSFTQFIVITHSKKTMAGADTLYGVTMEESGVSKRVSVRFEDVSDDGQILPSAMFRASGAEETDAESSAAIDDAPRKRAA
ncbi:MAG: chromosome segregation protein SMC [Pirellulales bacterium]